jgi:hypothetical protein
VGRREGSKICFPNDKIDDCQRSGCRREPINRLLRELGEGGTFVTVLLFFAQIFYAATGTDS